MYASVKVRRQADDVHAPWVTYDTLDDARRAYEQASALMHMFSKKVDVRKYHGYELTMIYEEEGKARDHACVMSVEMVIVPQEPNSHL
jgi:hypothetical protein